MAQYLEPGWGTGVGLGGWAPSVAKDPGARVFARVQRLASSPGAAMALLRSYMEIDVRAALPLVHAPTLVLHRTGDRMVPVAHGRYVADHIAGAGLVESRNRSLLVDRKHRPDPRRDRGVPHRHRSVLEPDRVLASVLFTDIVDSTRRAAELGDREWRLLFNRHDALAERQITRYGGRLIKTTGDGVLATFDGPARSVRCAQAINEGAQALGLSYERGCTPERSSGASDDIAGSESISPPDRGDSSGRRDPRFPNSDGPSRGSGPRV